MPKTDKPGRDGRIAIRPAWPGEAGLVLSFIRELAEFEKLGDEVTASEQRIDRALFGPMPRAFCDIAEWEGEPAGFALWFYNFSTFRGQHGIYLEDLFVKPGFRGKGIGKALLARLARRCVEEGLGRLEWWVLDWNEAAIDVYRSLGAEAMDEWTVFRLSGEALDRLAGQVE
ncbi:N-acetyltransferase family protein [Microbaculum sp. FT89]|uniref:GNAT family N-acetyltransferase n=1 Tax=Microbaculum sp. FT89 TaxID=3447298 RepID=UPI003F52F682